MFYHWQVLIKLPGTQTFDVYISVTQNIMRQILQNTCEIYSSDTNCFPHSHWGINTVDGHKESATHVISYKNLSCNTALAFIYGAERLNKNDLRKLEWPVFHVLRWQKAREDYANYNLINHITVLSCNWVCRTMCKAQKHKDMNKQCAAETKSIKKFNYLFF